MTKRGNRNKKKKKPVLYRGMAPGFTPGTGDVPFGPQTVEERDGKAVLEDECSDEAPEEYESFSGCSKKGGPSLKKMNTLKKPKNLMNMATWTAEEYEKYNSYLIKKWEISGLCDADGFYVGARDYHSPVAFAARTFHKFDRIIHGRILPNPSQKNPLPDLSHMHKWTPHEYDLYDLSLMNKWRISGMEENEATYASTRDRSTLIFKMAENMKKTDSKCELLTQVSETTQAEGKRIKRM